MQCCIGFDLPDASLPHPDIGDSHTLLAGIAARFATRPPEPDRKMLARLNVFVKKWLKDNLRPLSPDTDVSFETWIKNTNYPDWRKQELRAEWEKLGSIRNLKKKDRKVNMFMKKEHYLAWKHGRAINSRSDAFKVAVGPIFAQIEHEVFKLPYFIKKIPVPDRARYIFERLSKPGATYYASDFTSFEALFTREIMEAVEFELYEYMTKCLAVGQDFMSLVREVLGGVNNIHNKNISLDVEATRMSGEMCTSLGNGFSNLMFNLFLAHEKGARIDGVVEGDDGLFRIEGNVPVTEDFAQLGLIVKLESHVSLSTASFCGQVFDETTYSVIADPRKIMASIGWIDGDYKNAKRGKQMGMLRAKGWSLGYQYPACPVLSSLARAILRITRSCDQRVVLHSRSLNEYEKSLYLDAFAAGRPELNKPVADSTRHLMEKIYGITPQQQETLEKYFDSMTELGPLPRIDVPIEWIEYRSRYVVPLGPHDDIPPFSYMRYYDAPLPEQMDHELYYMGAG